MWFWPTHSRKGVALFCVLGQKLKYVRAETSVCEMCFLLHHFLFFRAETLLKLLSDL